MNLKAINRLYWTPLFCHNLCYYLIRKRCYRWKLWYVPKFAAASCGTPCDSTASCYSFFYVFYVWCCFSVIINDDDDDRGLVSNSDWFTVRLLTDLINTSDGVNSLQFSNESNLSSHNSNDIMVHPATDGQDDLNFYLFIIIITLHVR